MGLLDTVACLLPDARGIDIHEVDRVGIMRYGVVCDDAIRRTPSVIPVTFTMIMAVAMVAVGMSMLVGVRMGKVGVDMSGFDAIGRINVPMAHRCRLHHQQGGDQTY